MLYYSIFQQLFKFIPRYRFEKKAEATSDLRVGTHPGAVIAVREVVHLHGLDVVKVHVAIHSGEGVRVDPAAVRVAVVEQEGQAAGLYAGTLTISAEGAEPVRIPFTVRVNGFSLGRVSELPLMVDCRPVQHGNWSVAKIPDSPFNAWRRHKDEWTDFLADYLISTDDIYRGGKVDFGAIERLLSQGRLGKRFCLGYVGMPKSTNDANVAAWRAASELLLLTNHWLTNRCLSSYSRISLPTDFAKPQRIPY